MSYIWIDLWNKNCWIAIEIEGVIIPKWVFDRHKIINILKRFIDSYNIKTIVVWLPYDLYNNDTRQLDRTNKFIDKLRIIFPTLDIKWFDERYSSIESGFILEEMWIKAWKKDDLSASIILENFLKTNK